MEDFLAYLDTPPPLYTPSEHLPPPAYTLPSPATNTSAPEPDVTETEITASETEPAIPIDPVPLDAFLTLELLTRLIRCIKVTLRIIRSDGDGQEWYEEILEVSGVLERYLDRVTTTEETKEELKELVKLARQSASWIWEYGKREETFVRMRRLGLGSGEEQNRIKKELEAVDKRLLGKEFLGKLCSPEEAHSLNQRNHFTWIKNIDRYLHDLIWILPTLNQGHPLQPAMLNMLEAKFDVETEDDFFEAMRKPSFADLRGRVMQSLRYPNRTSRFEAISEPCPGTCQWIFDALVPDVKETFGTWLKSSLHTRLDWRYWISGDPGTGKSVLMKYLVMEARRNPTILKRPEDEEIPIVLSHFFDNDGDLMHRTTQGMILNLLVQLFDQDPVLIDVLFHYLISDITKYRALHKTSAEWESYELWDLLSRALGDVEDMKKKVFIFIDGPSGFDIKPPNPAQPEPAYIDRNVDIHELPDRQELSLKPEPMQFIHFLNLYTEAKIIVATRPEGAFHNPCSIKLNLHLENALLRHDIKTLCHYALDHLRFSQRHSYTRKILRECNCSFTEALDALDQIKRQTSDSSQNLPPLLPRSESLYSSLLTRFQTSHSRLELQSLSKILNLLFTYEAHHLSCLRSSRPLSLFQVTLCTQKSLISTCLNNGAFEIPRHVIDGCEDVANQIEKRLYPFVTLRETEQPPICRSKLWDLEYGVSADEARAEVCFIHPSLREWLLNTEQGRGLLRVDEASLPDLVDQAQVVRRHLLGTVDEETKRAELARDRLKLLLRAGMFEEIVLWRATAKNVERMASELGRVYREYVRFAERSTVLGYLREEEVFPESWVVKFASGNQK